MDEQREGQPTVYGDLPRRRPLTTSAVALQAIIVNEQEQALLLSSPTRQQGWQVISGALDAGETVLDGTLREVREEVGEAVQVRPLGVVHAQTFHYDAKVHFMIGIFYLLAYEGGEIVPGDDMTGSEARWWSPAALAAAQPKLHASTRVWILERAVQLYRLWREEGERPLQPPL